MAQPNWIAIEKTFFISRRITWFFFMFFISTGIMAFFIRNFSQTWLKAIFPWLAGLSFLLFGISWIMPGIFILLRVPWFARAWLKGIIPRITIKPWKELSKGEVFSTYYYSILISGSIVLAIIGIILNGNILK